MKTKREIGENHHRTEPAIRETRQTARRIDHPCSVRQLCPRCSLMKVIQYRFKAFKRAFGREPLPNEPLFFASAASPVKASGDEMMKQLEQAANATGVSLPSVLRLLGVG
jgi:hypothetical protein